MKILASIGGYGANGSDAVTIAALRQPDGILVIVRQVEYQAQRKPGMAFVTNMKMDAYDCMFLEEHLSPAIRAYREMVGQGLLTFSDDSMKFTPRIETDGIDERGQKYRLDENISNGQMAVLAIVHFVSRQQAITSTATLAERMAGLYDIMSV
jgi:hypothetical protein